MYKIFIWYTLCHGEAINPSTKQFSSIPSAFRPFDCEIQCHAFAQSVYFLTVTVVKSVLNFH